MTAYPAHSGPGDLSAVPFFAPRSYLRANPAPAPWDWTGLSAAPLPAGDLFVNAATAVQGLAFNAASVKAARDFTTRVLREWELEPLRSDTLLVVSELVTNACRHAVPGAGALSDWSIQFGLVRHESRLACLVFDPSTEEPVRVDPDERAEGGRGLALIEAFSSDWGWRALRGQGKVVWASFDTAA
ncbi:ATP-binding protein [Nocardiopsis potens]|uniref:ATP-binding protein n=1 Tax=Nocardiopsis potens TaxID=1246458 RepID=UPI00034AAD85|nr:ATP-binding protein [Nocardiopsis potens]